MSDLINLEKAVNEMKNGIRLLYQANMSLLNARDELKKDVKTITYKDLLAVMQCHHEMTQINSQIGIAVEGIKSYAKLV